MLTGIHPILTGEILLHLDQMGHSDAVVIADAHFPTHRLGARAITVPMLTTSEVVAAIRTVFPLDSSPALDLMASADGTVLDVQRELIAAAHTTADDVRYFERFDYYDLAERSYLVIRTGETRTYANALLRKGLVGPYNPAPNAPASDAAGQYVPANVDGATA